MSDLTRQTRQQQEANAVAVDRGAELIRKIQGARSGVSAALAKRIDPDQFLRALATDIRKTPHLDECDPDTVLGGMFTAAQMGLEIGSHRGLAYLVPYRNKDRGIYEASLIIGYKGFVDLFYRAGAKAVQWFLVREGDQFRIGSDARIGKTYEWIQADPNSRAPVTGVVAQVVTPNDGVVWEYLSKADVDKRAKDTPFWRNWRDEMTLKTGLRRLVATAPVSTDLRRANEVDETVLRRVPGLEQAVPTQLPVRAPAALPAPQQASQQQRPKPGPPPSQRPPQQPSDGDRDYDEPSAEEWAEIERQQLEDAAREQEQGA